MQEMLNNYLGQVKIGRKQSHKNLDVFPLLLSNGGSLDYLLLDEALDEKSIDIIEAHFDGLLAAGVFTPGHAPAEALFELDRLVRPGGAIIFSLKWDGVFKHAFLETLAQLEDEARWQRQSWSAVYSSWPRVDQNMKSRVLVFRTPRRARV